jgi:hypothetical protein
MVFMVFVFNPERSEGTLRFHTFGLHPPALNFFNFKPRAYAPGIPALCGVREFEGMNATRAAKMGHPPGIPVPPDFQEELSA